MVTIESAVTDRLRRLVVGGEFPPAYHLQEIPIASLLRVSRTPVRAALATLAQEGLLVSRPKRGYFVRQVSLKEVLDAYRVRGQLEGLACRILSEHGVDEAAMTNLVDCIDTGERILSSGRLSDDSLPWRENNERFHRTLVGATGNAALIEATMRTASLPLVSSRVVQWSDYSEIRVAQYHHAIILEAIRERQASRAEAMMIEHVHVASERLKRSFD